MTSGKTRLVVIDDTDHEIRYNGKGWSQEGPSALETYRYNNTLHKTRTRGDSFSYAFNGTSVFVRGIIDATNSQKHESLDCYVDRKKIQSLKPKPHRGNQVLCWKDNISIGEHELEVQFMPERRGAFSFDSIQYTPSLGLSLENAVVKVNNQDSGIVLDSNWELFDDHSSTKVFGSTATFNFTGTSVTWIGTMIPNASQTVGSISYTIDGGVPKPFNISASPASDNFTNAKHELFTQPGLLAGPHILVVAYNDHMEQALLTLDHLFFTSTSIPAWPAQPENKRSPVGVIAGGVIGGLFAAIAIVLFAVWWYRRRKRRSEHLENLERSPVKYGAHTLDFSSKYTHPNLLNYPHPSFLSSGKLSRSSLALSGYTPATVAQTRALRDYQAMNPYLNHLPAPPYEGDAAQLSEDGVIRAKSAAHLV